MADTPENLAEELLDHVKSPLRELPPAPASEPASSRPTRNASSSHPKAIDPPVARTVEKMAPDREPPLPLISRVMPTYGRPLYVNEAVEMFLRQDYPRKELIVLNDCPGQHFTCDHPEVRVVNHPTRYPTLGKKRNASIELAEGEIIAIRDDDDVYLPWRLSFSFDEMPPKRRILEIVGLTCRLVGAKLDMAIRKPFDVLAEGLLVPSSRGDRI